MPMVPVQRPWPLHAGLLLAWFVASFGLVFFARDLMLGASIRTWRAIDWYSPWLDSI